MQGSRHLAIMFLLGATLVGGALGFAADRYVVKDRLCAPKLSERQLRTGVYDDLALSAGQRAAWDSLLDERHRNMAAARASIRPKTDSIWRSYVEKTMLILNPEQRERLEQHRREDREREKAKTAKDRK